ncbi:MAG TPA: HD domain-containing protein [Candidatus Saccharimonadales bacterium]|nr:HD domain-containing protein [Candidatus Saccharimonadales bacterium]
MNNAGKPPIRRLIDLYKLVLDLRGVERAMRIPGTEELENDVDHTYALAMLAWFLAPHFPELNRDTVIRISLAHDLLEVHSGDTPVFGSRKHLDTKAEREAAALTQLAADWPDFPELHALLEDYEVRGSDEAKFVYALDKVAPIIMGALNGGLDYRGQNVTKAASHASKSDKVALSPPVDEYYHELLDLLDAEYPEFFAK